MNYENTIKIRGATHYMGGYDGGFGDSPMFMRNRMVFAPADGVTAGKGAPSPSHSGESKPKFVNDAPSAGQSVEDASRTEEKTVTESEKPSPEEARLLREVMKNKDEARKLREQLNAFSGIDPDEARKLIEDRAKVEQQRIEAEQKAEEERAKAAGDYESLRKTMAKKHEEEVKTLNSRYSDLEKANQSLISQIENMTVGSSFSNSDFIRNDTIYTPSKARILYGSYFDVEEGGKVVGYDKPRGAADRNKIVGSDGNPLSFEAALKQIIESDPEKDAVLRSSVRSGTGHRPAESITTKSQPNVSPGAGRIAAALKAQKDK